MRIFFILFFIPVMLFASDCHLWTVSSPDNTIQITVQLDAGRLYYSVSKNKTLLISPSRLGFKLGNDDHFDSNFKFVAKKQTSQDTTWTTVWGEQKNIRNHYRELSLVLTRNPDMRLELDFRAFDDGVAFRYCIPEQPNLDHFEIMDELTEFNMHPKTNAWWIPAFAGNRYEYLYRHTSISEIDTIHTPVTLETPDHLFLSIHEAALTDFSSMTLVYDKNKKLKAYLVPWSDGVKVKTRTPMYSPWRTIQIAKKPGDLITSSMILNLNEPNKLNDVSWIQPGKYVGIWWEMHIDVSTWASGPKHGATTENAKHYIDFASKYGFDGVLIEGWNLGWDGDWTQNGEIGDYITLVRRDRRSADWYLGSITDEHSRKFDIRLDFLDPDMNYIAEIYADGERADWKRNPYDIRIENQQVNRNTTLSLKLAAGGGAAIRFEPVQQ